MNDCVRCNLCDQPGTCDDALDRARIPSNVRYFRRDSFTVWRCNGCGSLHCKDDVDLAHYYRHYIYDRQQLDYFTRCAYAGRVRQLRRWGWKPQHSLLDYGCGSGTFVRYLRAQGAFARGYDPYHKSWDDNRVLEAEYDVVTAYDVIEHVDDPESFLRERCRQVRPGGMLVIVTPNAGPLSLDQPWRPELHQPYHRHILSEKALVDLGRKAGMELLGVDRRYFIDTWWPAVNTRFVWEYVHALGGEVDVVFERPQIGRVLRSPKLLFLALFGYWFPPDSLMLAAFRVGGADQSAVARR